MIHDNFYSQHKSRRILHIYTRLIKGDTINKAEEAERFKVDRRTIQRDIEELRAFFENQFAEGQIDKQLIYNRSMNRYYLRCNDETVLSNSEILAVCKILLESRSMRKTDMEIIISKLLNSCVPQENQSVVKSLIANELLHYIEPRHKKQFIDDLWNIGIAVKEHKMLKIRYQKQDGSAVERTIKPVGIMFSEFYFYLTAFIEGIDKKSEFHDPDDIFPTIYRIDRIQSYKVMDKHFDIPYKDKFEEGEFRKRIQFMYGGKLRRIKFKYTGKNVEAVLDRLPTAKVIQKIEGGYILTAEVFGNGVDMWIRSQGDLIELINEK